MYIKHCLSNKIYFYLELVMVKNNENAIREAAYYIWQNAGCPQGQDEVFWSMAVEQICGCNNKASCKKASCKTSASKTSSAKKTSAKKSAK